MGKFVSTGGWTALLELDQSSVATATSQLRNVSPDDKARSHQTKEGIVILPQIANRIFRRTKRSEIRILPAFVS